jgi:A/G-specific adenine glycosylase
MMSLAPRLLAWFDAHGRHDFPWQHARTPYSVWVSEIMLQQTQVGTVIPFYERFMRRFPTIAALAAVPLDDVLALWAGLGYYARARNLWRAARSVVAEHGGELPTTFDDLHALPGIGRSTAGAILAQAHGQRWPILDGNVKRVLARYHAVAGWPGLPAVANELWRHADAHTPRERVADYTQAIMDLGATVCARARPACTVCPLAADCAAAQSRHPSAVSAPRPKRGARAAARRGPRRARARRPRAARAPAGERHLGAGSTACPSCRPGLTARLVCAHARCGRRGRAGCSRSSSTRSRIRSRPRAAPARARRRPSTIMDRDDWHWCKPARSSTSACRRRWQHFSAAASWPHSGRMARKVTCVLLGPDSEGLDRPPYPGALGQRIYENVSKLAWQRWVKHQTMLLNEYRLTPIEPKARKFLEDEMQKFFFGQGSEAPPDYKPPQ